MSTCPACGDEFRKGRKALLLLPTGELSPRVVCKDCATSVAVRIVPLQRAAPVAQSPVSSDGITQLYALKRKLVAFRTQAEIIPSPAFNNETAGRILGLDQAIALVDCLLDGRPL